MKKDKMFYRFALYGFLKNLRFFEPFMLLFFLDNGLSFFQIGALYSARDLATNVLEIPSGVYADVFGRRRSMLMSFGAYILSFIIFYVSSGFYAYILAMLFFACGEAFRTGTHKALILEYLRLKQMQAYKVAYYGRTRAASQLGSAVNSLIAAGLVFYTGNYRYVFIASILPYALDLINLARYPPELDGQLAHLEKDAMRKQTKMTLVAFFALFKDPRAMRSILNSAGFTAFFKATKDYLQPILKAFALSLPIFVALDETRRVSLVIGLVYFGIYLLTSYASRSADQISTRFDNLARAINYTFVMGAVFLLLAGLTVWQNLAIIAIFVFLALFVLQNLRKPMSVALISDQISHNVMASGLSVESQFATILMALLSPLLGALADNLGVGGALTILGGAMLLMTLFVKVESRPPLSSSDDHATS